MALLVAPLPFWEGASKGGFTICDTQKLCSAENAILIVFSAKHSFAEIKECKLKNRSLPIIGGCVTCKKVFFVFLGGLVCFFCVFVLLFLKKAQKGYFPAFFSISKLRSPKRPKSVFSSHYVIFLVFPLSSLFKIPYFVFAFCHQPPFENDISFGFLLFIWNKLS